MKFLYGLFISLCLSACATSPHQPASENVADLASPRGQQAYNKTVRSYCAKLRHADLNAGIGALADSGISVEWPKVPLPLRDVEVSRHAATSAGSIGVPVVLRYDTASAPLYPPEGLFIDATAVLLPRDGMNVLSFETRGDSVEIGGKHYPLARDYAGASQHLKRSAGKLAGSGFASMLRPASMQRKPQIYLLDLYDPKKVPLLMVHGLQSTPVAFAQMVDALRSDPVIREKYQIWQFYYPSGSPVLANAADLRDSLRQTLRTLDPGGCAVASRRMVVVGHSMGGVISHTLVSSSGPRLWSAVFKVPPSQLQGDSQAVRDLERILEFKRTPNVARVVFMAAPHHGSPMADSFIGWFGNFLARLSPMEEKGFSGLARKNPQAMMPDAAKFYDGGRFSAVRTLSPKSTALVALAGLPIEVSFHSVIGQQHRGPANRGSDGVVPYWSSHLEGSRSELIVRSGHGVIGNPQAVQEVIRILHEDSRN